jgi:hypothetical protein
MARAPSRICQQGKLVERHSHANDGGRFCNVLIPLKDILR